MPHPNASHAILIANPAAGQGRAIGEAEKAKAQLKAGGWTSEVLKTRGAGDAATLAGSCAPAQVVIAVGGDGTIYEVVNGLMSAGRDLNIGTLPVGSGNSLALDVGLTSCEQAIERVLARKTRPLDVIRATLDGTVHHAINVIGWGAAARITTRSESMRWARGLRYDLATLVELLRPRIIPGATYVDGECDRDEVLGVAALTQHSGRGMRVAPPALLDDGKLDVVTIRRGFRPKLLSLLVKVHSGKHMGSPLVRHRQATHVDLRLEDDSGVVIDGEWFPGHELTLEVLPQRACLWA